MNIGIIKYRKYEERVLMDSSFSIDGLFRIILEDGDFEWFHVVDREGKVLISTTSFDLDSGAILIRIPKIRRDEEILGTDYNAYRDPPYIHKTKVTWIVEGYVCGRKKDAHGYAEWHKRRSRQLIEKTIK
ncbi:hypothetical protein [Pedobacter xixiisoli]|uniref:Uncharacterized protein n=1 Tax=Pedobacter xixiisoli TaxID=1476464 RepID=A0A286A7B5_9SPHI|nr:hypothetical protein [Pedobacter xixiisoli]SOD17765.1 hypothetical protein SAMN06297358_2676 [Pedobacter xixiisoli]